MKRIVMILMVAALLIAGSVTAVATSNTLKELERIEEEQKQKAEDLAQKKEEQLRRREQQKALLNDIESQFDVIDQRLQEGDDVLKDLFDSIGDLELEIVDMNLSIDELDLALEEKQNEIDNVRLSLKKIRSDKEILHGQAMERIRVMYEYGETGYLEVILEAENLMDMFGRMEYINRLVAADRDLFESLDRFEEDILSKETSLEIYEASLLTLKDEVLVEKSKLEDRVITKGLEVEHANELIDLQLAEQAELEQEEAQTEAQIKNIQAQLNAIEAEEKRVDEELRVTLAKKAAEVARLSGLNYNGGAILWPVPGWSRISSPFGPRLHPIQKIWKDHNGIDIPASGGTPIIAVMSGEVIIAKYSSSYGNYCAIAHGNGYLSLYAHCSSLNVKVGDKVEAGQTIAKVGTTGWSTGNHLHFGFQKNDVWVNPMDYVK